MTKSNIGKVLIGMVLLVGSARAGQWQFARESTLVPAGPDETALGIQTLRVHSPVGAGEVTTMRVEIIDVEQKVIGHLIDSKSPAVRGRGNAPEEMIELAFGGRTVKVHYKDRAIWISDGAAAASASFDRTSPEDVERMKAFADDFRLIAGIQTAARPAIQRAAALAPVRQAGILGPFGIQHVSRLVPASWSAWLRGSPAKDSPPVCHTEPAHAKCAGGFGASRTSGCAFAQQEANNECAEASGWCIGCCAWLGSGCDCSCLFGDLACMCESCGGLCGPAANMPASNPGSARAK